VTLAKIEFYGLKVTEEIRPGTNLPELIVKEAEKQAHGIREGDIVVVTSKIVSDAGLQEREKPQRYAPGRVVRGLEARGLGALQDIETFFLVLEGESTQTSRASR